MPVKTGRRSLRKSAKRIYQKEYNTAKAEALRKARLRSRKQIQEKARKKANAKYNRTPQERSAANKKKMKDISTRLKAMSESMVDGFEQETKKNSKKSSGKRSKSIWDMTIDDMI